MTKSKKNLRRHYAGCYRATLRCGQQFAQFLRASLSADGSYSPSTNGRSWLVEIRDTDTGALVRYAGVFNSLQAAVDDVSPPKYLEVAHG